MSDIESSGDEAEELYIFYRNRPEWSDVHPIRITEGPIAAIRQSDKFKDVFDYFRAIITMGEVSERAFQLTTDAAKLNATNYTVWQYRRRLLLELEKDLAKELDFMEEIIEDNPKNYQVWHHREAVVMLADDASREVDFLNRMLKFDPKNYHAWQYRQSIVGKFKLFDRELEIVDSLIQEDVRNNSAWNHRYFVLSYTTSFAPKVIDEEIDYTLEAIKKVKGNESSWSYLRGVLLHSLEGIQHPKVLGFAQDLYTKGVKNVEVMSFLIDAAMEKLPTDDEEKRTSRIDWIKMLCRELAETVDTTRRNYWQFLADSVGEGASDQAVSG